MTKPIVVMHIDESGDWSVLATAGVRVIYVDDRVPNDRIYERQERDDAEAIAAMIDGEAIGHVDDGKSTPLRKALRQIN